MNRRLDKIDEGEPSTPLGATAAAMFELAGDTKAIVMLRDDTTGEYITAHHGYDDNRDPVVDLMIHMQAIAAAAGLRLDFASLDEHGVHKVEGFEAEGGPTDD